MEHLAPGSSELVARRARENTTQQVPRSMPPGKHERTQLKLPLGTSGHNKTSREQPLEQPVHQVGLSQRTNQTTRRHTPTKAHAQGKPTHLRTKKTHSSRRPVKGKHKPRQTKGQPNKRQPDARATGRAGMRRRRPPNEPTQAEQAQGHRAAVARSPSEGQDRGGGWGAPRGRERQGDRTRAAAAPARKAPGEGSPGAATAVPGGPAAQPAVGPGQARTRPPQKPTKIKCNRQPPTPPKTNRTDEQGREKKGATQKYK